MKEKFVRLRVTWLDAAVISFKFLVAGAAWVWGWILVLSILRNITGF